MVFNYYINNSKNARLSWFICCSDMLHCISEGKITNQKEKSCAMTHSDTLDSLVYTPITALNCGHPLRINGVEYISTTTSVNNHQIQYCTSL